MAPTVNLLSNWIFSVNPEDWPCTCCDAPRAMDHEDGYWICDIQNRTWLVIDTPFNHLEHPLINDEIIQMIHSDATGLLWGDLLLADEYAVQARETSAQRAERLQKEQEAEAERHLNNRAAEMERYARIKAQVNTIMLKDERGKKTITIRKIMEPCKWLYLDETAPKHEWRTTRGGKLEPPYRPYLTGATCWAWEYIDPKTKKRIIKHTCDHLHPGEENWCNEWNLDKEWRNNVTASRDFSYHRDFSGLRKNNTTSMPSRTTLRPAPSAPVRPPAPKGKKNSRGTFLDFDDFEC